MGITSGNTDGVRGVPEEPRGRRRFEDFFNRPFPMMGTPRWASIKEDIHVDITGKTVTISGEKKKEERIERKDYVHIERSHGSFVRTFHISSEVETDKAVVE